MIEPVTVAEAAEHLRIDTDSPFLESTYLSTLITVARQYCENYLARTIGSQTRTLTLSAFPLGSLPIELPNPPVYSVDSVSYVAQDGTTATLTGVILSNGYIQPAYGTEWPIARAQIGAVTISYSAGYVSGGSPDDFPLAIKQAMLLVIGDLYQNREGQFVGVTAQVNPTVMNLLTPYRVAMGI